MSTNHEFNHSPDHSQAVNRPEFNLYAGDTKGLHEQFCQQNLARINNSVDVPALGFPDLQINLDQRHTGSHFEVKGTVSVGDGQTGTIYQVEKGDNLWKLSSGLLSEKLGRTPTDTEVQGGVNALSNENKLQDPNKLKIGQVLQIPDSLLPQDTSTAWNPYDSLTTQRSFASPSQYWTPYESVTAQPAAPVDNVIVPNPLVVPGMNPTDGSINHREMTDAIAGNGVTHADYKGALNDGVLPFGMDRTSFTSEADRDAEGNLQHSKITYDTSWGAPSISVPDGHGGKNKVHAKSVESYVDKHTGNTYTTIIEPSGRSHVTTTDSNGNVSQTVDSPEPEISLPLFYPM